MIDETNAANSGAAQPASFDSSTWMKSKPWNGWFLFSIRPYICTPQPVQAWRWIAAFSSTIFSLSAFAVTLRLSRPTTPTSEKVAPFGFQHLVQPQTWLKATSPLIFTLTASFAHWHVSVPPAKLPEPFFTPLSTDGWMFTLAM